MQFNITLKLTTLACALCFSLLQGQTSYNDPNIPKPATGYGADGQHTVGLISFVNSNFPLKNIEIYYPSDITTKVPTIFYSHAYGGNISANIQGLLNFVAMKGYAIVFVPYQTTGVSIYDRYDNLLAGFRKAARNYPGIIDTTKVGFLGHSFGGGASFGNGYKCFTENNWGQNGRFIYALAQWYAYNISQAELQSFPANTKLLTEVFDDDVTNDHRMAIDIFNNITIPPAEKDFILLKSDTLNSYVYVADHAVPNTAAAFDAFDYYAYYRLLDALCDYTFNGSLAGKNVALGNGSTAQVTMPGGLRSLIQTDDPASFYPQNKYEFPCGDTLNLRSAYCPVTATVGIQTYSGSINKITFYPNPASDNMTILLPATLENQDLIFYNSQGKCVYSVSGSYDKVLNLDLSLLPKGFYYLKYGNAGAKLLLQ